MSTPPLNCLGFIMDGNRRWAQEHDLPVWEGHRRGSDVLRTCIDWLQKQRIPHAVFYAFSTENWRRSNDEVEQLMNLFREQLAQLKDELAEKTQSERLAVRVRTIGHRDAFAPDIVSTIKEVEVEYQPDEPVTTVWLALSYGGRAEILAAINEAVERGEPVTEDSFESLLWTAQMPDPDMIVRTSGERRLSNFVTWRSVYSELHFIEKHWPALTEADFDDILTEYDRRERRRGT